MNRIVTDRMDELKQLCKDYNVKTMYAFGSVCTEVFHENSDIDFLIAFENLSIEQYTDNYFDLHYKLEDLFGNISSLQENTKKRVSLTHNMDVFLSCDASIYKILDLTVGPLKNKTYATTTTTNFKFCSSNHISY